MNKKDLKNLAKHTVMDGKIHPKIAKFVMQNLNKTDLREYLFYLKQEIKNQIVFVRTPQDLLAAEKKQIEKLYVSKRILFENDKSLGAGITILNNDNIIDASLKGYIDQAIQELKN